MARRVDPVTVETHRKIAGRLFNRVWELMDQKRRTRAEEDEMLHATHASRYHWGRAGTSLQGSIGEWQISRVYVVLGRAEPALFHARRALEIARRARLGRFYVAYAYEALARANALAHQRGEQARYLRLARKTAVGIRDADDRRMLDEDLATISDR